MQTKLVYVLTCAPEATYIEQALISIWSARYHNPDAYIVLLVDDLTNQLLVGKRAEVLEYVSEKIVVPFDENISMMYRSRYIKTNARQLVDGDMLFIDCDTIINHALDEIDKLSFEVGAVLESNLTIDQFCPALYQSMNENAVKIGWNPEVEQYYFSSGVIYAKDTPRAHRLFEQWHQEWLDGIEKGINIDQPSLAKANIECEHIIQRIDDKWNCIMFTYPRWAKNAGILHFASYRNMSFLFTKRVLQYIRENGLTDYIKQYILHPSDSYIPFDSEFYHYQLTDYVYRFKSIYRGIKNYTRYIDSSVVDCRPLGIIYILLKYKLNMLATIVLLLSKWRYTQMSKKYKYIENICSK